MAVVVTGVAVVGNDDAVVVVAGALGEGEDDDGSGDDVGNCDACESEGVVVVDDASGVDPDDCESRATSS